MRQRQSMYPSRVQAVELLGAACRSRRRPSRTPKPVGSPVDALVQPGPPSVTSSASTVAVRRRRRTAGRRARPAARARARRTAAARRVRPTPSAARRIARCRATTNTHPPTAVEPTTAPSASGARQAATSRRGVERLDGPRRGHEHARPVGRKRAPRLDAGVPHDGARRRCRRDQCVPVRSATNSGSHRGPGAWPERSAERLCHTDLHREETQDGVAAPAGAPPRRTPAAAGRVAQASSTEPTIRGAGHRVDAPISVVTAAPRRYNSVSRPGLRRAGAARVPHALGSSIPWHIRPSSSWISVRSTRSSSRDACASCRSTRRSCRSTRRSTRPGARHPVGLILSGGPRSVRETAAPRCDPASSTWPSRSSASATACS